MKLKGIFSTVIAIAFGLLVLVGYLFGVNADGTPSLLGQLESFILNVAVILAGFAVLVGIINLLIVHTGKVRQKQTGAIRTDRLSPMAHTTSPRPKSRR